MLLLVKLLKSFDLIFYNQLLLIVNISEGLKIAQIISLHIK